MSMHTKRPWTYELGDGIWMIGCDEDYNFATVYINESGDEEIEGLQSDPTTAEANARLIAAAPDLLAACKAVLEGLQAAPHAITDVIWINPPWVAPAVHETIFERLEAVIAKAERKA